MNSKMMNIYMVWRNPNNLQQIYMNRTPTKYSTPTSTKTHKEPPTPTSTAHSPSSPSTPSSPISPHSYSVLKLITPHYLSTPTRKSSLLLNKSLSNSEDCYVEDRFIPTRRRLIAEFQMGGGGGAGDMEEEDGGRGRQGVDPQVVTVADIYSEEILGKSVTKQGDENDNNIEIYKNRNLLKYRIESPTKPTNFYPSSLTDLSPHPKPRRIPKNPIKVLDAPALSDDFYLNLIDWSSQNQLAVGLGNCIYLWNAETSKVTRLCQLSMDSITSVCWDAEGRALAVGCNKGNVLIWDVNEQREVRRMDGHQIRVGSMAWSRRLLSTGSRDKNILQRDIRSSRSYVQKLSEHGQEICGLKWSKDDQYLASGGNDNRVIVWNTNGHSINKFTDHKAAVKAIAWSPHQHGLLATGGGTADRMIKMRNIFTGEIICSEDTGSQICNLEFSKSLHEVVSTHGYSQNQINVWSYPNMKKVATLKGHTHRVLYLATSPDGSTIVTGAGDETLRFWNIFPSINELKGCNESLLESGITFR